MEKLGGEFLGYKQVAPLGQGNRTEVDLVAQDMFMGRTDGETGCRLQTGCSAGARVSNGGGFGCAGYVHGPYRWRNWVGNSWATNRLLCWGKGNELRLIWLRRVCSWAVSMEKLGGEFLGYKQVAPLGQGYRTKVDLVAQGMFMGRTDGETGCRL